MIDFVTSLIQDAGWFAPLYYIGSFVLTALLPFIPTPLVGALGGTAFGFLPAVLYGVLGLGLGAFTALTLSRRIGRPLLLRLVRPEAWAQWEKMLGIEQVWVWGVVFFVLNLDFAVVAAGLTTLPARRLWVAAMIARLPWLVASAWVGDVIIVSDWVLLLMLVLMVPALWALNRVRPWLQGWLLRLGRDRA